MSSGVQIELIPVNLLTGFLGSGKSTLLTEILQNPEFCNTAVVVNEFGEIGLDGVLIEHSKDQIVEMTSGCLCCTIRGDIRQTLVDLHGKCVKGQIPNFNRVIVESTGLADPAPVAQTFFVDQDVADRTKLDAIVSIADAVHLDQQLGEHHEAEEQIAFADIVLLNKTDLVKGDNLEGVQSRIRKINPYAKIIKTAHCETPLDQVLGLDAFSLDRVLEIEPDFLESDHDHEHDDDVTSLSFVSETPLDLDKFQEWFGKLLQTCGQDILRSKGILDFAGIDDRYVFQGVHMLMDASPMGAWPEDKERSSRIVFIGRNLDSMNLQEGFDACKAA